MFTVLVQVCAIISNAVGRPRLYYGDVNTMRKNNCHLITEYPDPPEQLR